MNRTVRALFILPTLATAAAAVDVSTAPAPYASVLTGTQIKMVGQQTVESFKASTGPLKELDPNIVLAGASIAPYLIPLLQDKNPWARWNAIAALQALHKEKKLTPDTAKLVSAILEEMHDEVSHPQVRAKAGEGLR